jgi:7-cyano-7-deazaguanine synthase
MKTKALVIFSGGQDSTTCLFWAIDKFDEVEAITFDYGQKHAIEIEQSKLICKHASIKQTIVDISFLDTLVESALTSHGNVNEVLDNGLPASFVPNRNQLFITLAHAFAQKIGAESLVGGMCQTDYSGYPDCRDFFIQDLIKVSNEGSGLDSDKAIEMHTPLMYLTKAQTFDLADKIAALHEVITMSYTCYNGDREHLHEWGYGCGTCPACELRAAGWEEYKNDNYHEI